jgi:hypothetical protein
MRHSNHAIIVITLLNSVQSSFKVLSFSIRNGQPWCRSFIHRVVRGHGASSSSLRSYTQQTPMVVFEADCMTIWFRHVIIRSRSFEWWKPHASILPVWPVEGENKDMLHTVQLDYERLWSLNLSATPATEHHDSVFTISYTLVRYQCTWNMSTNTSRVIL